jgi:hypothetical protein
VPDVSVDAQRLLLGEWLQRRHASEPVVMRETHISLLAFTDDRVWKCKKAVRFPFIDLSTRELRRANCEREVTLNRRLADDVYLGVVPLKDANGAVADHLVEMRRLPDDRRLAAVCGRGDGGGECVDRVADRLVSFHATAATSDVIDRAASPEAIGRLWADNLNELQTYRDSVLPAATVDAVASDATRFLRGRIPLFRERIQRGCTRDGHGDLLADDVFCLADGPRVLDCLEFDDRLRYGDVLADVAFLAMDLQRLDRPDLARRLLDRYANAAADRWPPSLADFYVAYRALVRAKVACLRVADDPAAAGTARSLLDLTAQHLARGRVRMVLIGGPPATGKSTLAGALGGATGFTVLRSDETRKRLAGMSPETRAAAPLDEGLYASAWSDRTYAALLDSAQQHLVLGQSVILDASWASADHRAQAARVADDTASELHRFVCRADAATVRARAAQRARDATDASDAGPEVAVELAARFSPWPDAVVVDTGDESDASARLVLTRLGLDVSAA